MKMDTFKITWEELKQKLTESHHLYHHVVKGVYEIYAYKDPFLYKTSFKDKAEKLDFETNYLAGSNKNLELPVALSSQVQNSPFSAKILSDGKRLYVREHGLPKTEIAAGTTVAMVFEIPYPFAKINGAMLVGCKEHDVVNFKVLDTSSGLLTTIPMYPINQFGFDVNMPNGIYKKTYPYDADLFQGLHICVEYTNNGSESVYVSVNLDIHEVKV